MLIAKNFLTAWPSYKPSYLTSWSQSGVAGKGAVHEANIGVRAGNGESRGKSLGFGSLVN